MNETAQTVRNLLEGGLKRLSTTLSSGKLERELTEKLTQLEKKYEEEFKRGDEGEQGDYQVSFYHNFQVTVFRKIAEEIFDYSEYAPLLDDELGELYSVKTP